MAERMRLLATQVEHFGPTQAIVYGVDTRSGDRVAAITESPGVVTLAARLAAGAYAVPVEVNDTQLIRPGDPEPVTP